MTKLIAYSKQALRTLRRIPANESSRIRNKIEQYVKDAETLAASVKTLQGRDGYRLGVGNWRVILDENDVVIDVIAIGPRGNVYEAGAKYERTCFIQNAERGRHDYSSTLRI